MTEATKAKLKLYVKDAFVRDLLEGMGILYPGQIKAASDEELGRAGLNASEIAVLRECPKFAKAAESKSK